MLTGQLHAPAAFSCGGSPRYPFSKRLGGPKTCQISSFRWELNPDPAAHGLIKLWKCNAPSIDLGGMDWKGTGGGHV
jgi:hypothetical protein